MIDTPRPTRQVVHRPTRELVRRHRVALPAGPTWTGGGQGPPSTEGSGRGRRVRSSPRPGKPAAWRRDPARCAVRGLAYREQIKSGEFTPVPVRERMIPKRGGKLY